LFVSLPLFFGNKFQKKTYKAIKMIKEENILLQYTFS